MWNLRKQMYALKVKLHLGRWGERFNHDTLDLCADDWVVGQRHLSPQETASLATQTCGLESLMVEYVNA